MVYIEEKLIFGEHRKFVNTIYHRRGSLNFSVHAGFRKKREKDYNSSGNPAKFVAKSMQCFPQLAGIGISCASFSRETWKSLP